MGQAVKPEERTAPAARRGVRICFEWMEEIILAVVIVVVIFAFFFRVVSVHGSSMEPNFYGNDRIVISGMFYQVQQGDVVVIVNVLDKPIIKRVIALPGQTVDIDNEKGIVYVDGVALDESMYTENGMTFVQNPEMLDFPQVVPEECVFVLGDNRTVSQDSRYQSIGMIDTRNILGKAEFQIYPFHEIKKVLTPNNQ